MGQIASLLTIRPTIRTIQNTLVIASGLSVIGLGTSYLLNKAFGRSVPKKTEVVEQLKQTEQAIGDNSVALAKANDTLKALDDNSDEQTTNNDSDTTITTKRFRKGKGKAPQVQDLQNSPPAVPTAAVVKSDLAKKATNLGLSVPIELSSDEGFPVASTSSQVVPSTSSISEDSGGDSDSEAEEIEIVGADVYQTGNRKVLFSKQLDTLQELASTPNIRQSTNLMWTMKDDFNTRYAKFEQPAADFIKLWNSLREKIDESKKQKTFEAKRLTTALYTQQAQLAQTQMDVVRDVNELTKQCEKEFNEKFPEFRYKPWLPKDVNTMILIITKYYEFIHMREAGPRGINKSASDSEARIDMADNQQRGHNSFRGRGGTRGRGGGRQNSSTTRSPVDPTKLYKFSRVCRFCSTQTLFNTAREGLSDSAVCSNESCALPCSSNAFKGEFVVVGDKPANDSLIHSSDRSLFRSELEQETKEVNAQYILKPGAPSKPVWNTANANGANNPRPPSLNTIMEEQAKPLPPVVIEVSDKIVGVQVKSN